MSNVIGRLDIQSIEGASALLRDYVRGADTDVSKFLHRFTPAWSGAANDEAGRVDEGWTAVVNEIEALSARVGARDGVLRKLDGAKTRGTRFVVTGQQPGALGGPLHTVYKIATAIALAARVEAESGRPCLALYWIGADDSDFQEVRPLHLWTDALSPVSTAIAQDAHQGGMPVGDVSVGALAKVFASVRPFIEGFGAGETVSDAIDRALQSVNDHGELSAAVLMSVMDGRFVCVDGRSACVRRFGRSVFQTYLDGEAGYKDTINAAGRRLKQLGYHAQLTLGDEPGLFILEDGRRKSAGQADRALLRRMADENVEDLSPGVVVRNLLQDYVFRPVAVVLGPAELAYRAQMTSIFPQFDIPCPIAIPRLGGTFLPPQLADLVELHGGELPLLLEKPAEFARHTYRDALPDSLRRAAADFQAEITRLVDGFVDAHVSELPGRAQGKITGRLKDVARRADGAVEAVLEGGKSAAMDRWPFLSDLPDMIRPGHKAQERSLSCLMPFLIGGDGTVDVMIEMAAAHVVQLMDDRMSHVVYSV